MPLTVPNLDDRRYDDLVREALAIIPAIAPQWTNHNAADPGITLLELLAYIAELLIYRVNQVGDRQLEISSRCLRASRSHKIFRWPTRSAAPCWSCGRCDGR